jgi:rubrerythrin
MSADVKTEKTKVENEDRNPAGQRVYLCDRCGLQMHEKNCKVVCPNCGHRYDCSDLNIYFD